MAKMKVRSKKTIEQELQEMQEMDNYLKDQVRTFQYKINCKFKNITFGTKDFKQLILDGSKFFNCEFINCKFYIRPQNIIFNNCYFILVLFCKFKLLLYEPQFSYIKR